MCNLKCYLYFNLVLKFVFFTLLIGQKKGQYIGCLPVLTSGLVLCVLYRAVPLWLSSGCFPLRLSCPVQCGCPLEFSSVFAPSACPLCLSWDSFGGLSSGIVLGVVLWDSAGGCPLG